MVGAPASTSLSAPATVTTAYACGFQSQPSPINAHQNGPCQRATYPRGHIAHVVSNQPKKGSPFVFPFWSVVVASNSLLTWPGLRSRLFSQFQTGARASSSTQRCSRVRFLPLSESGAHSIRATRRQSAPAQSFPDQHRSQFGAAGVIHNRNRLSKFVSNAGFKPSEATNGCVPKHRRAFHEKEGELPNVSF